MGLPEAGVWTAVLEQAEEAEAEAAGCGRLCRGVEAWGCCGGGTGGWWTREGSWGETWKGGSIKPA